MRLLKFIAVLLIFGIFTHSLFAQESSNIYATWDPVELDTIASAWLIKRFIDPNAEFKFFTKGEFITEGVAFDTPDAEFRRTQNQSTFENIVSKYKIGDTALIEIGRIIHDTEINYWNKQLKGDSESAEKQIRAIIDSSPDSYVRFEKGFRYFDNLYRKKGSE